MKRTLYALVLCACSATWLGCGPLIKTPDHFIALEEHSGDFDYRATSADGVVLGARVLDFDEDRGGGLQFWVDAVKLRLSSMGGYALLKEQDVTTDSGLRGKELRFGRDEKKAPYQYWVTLLVTGDELVVVEAGGPEAKLVSHQARVAAAIRSVDP